MLKMFRFIFAAITIVPACVDTPNCIEDKEYVAYLTVPELKSGETISSDASLLKKIHGGHVIAISLAATDPSVKYTRLTPAQADAHMLATTGFKLYAGGPHDAVALAAAPNYNIPSSLLADWVEIPFGRTNPGANGCGIFATAVCNLQLGVTTKTAVEIANRAPHLIDQAEWDQTYTELGSFNGITPLSYMASYYQRKGFCTETKPLAGYCEDYRNIKQIHDAGCDVKFFYARKSAFWFSPYSTPHIETVVSDNTPAATTCSAHTNSWNYYTQISGGYCTEFKHGRNSNFGGDTDAWPPHDARVWVQTTCDCDILQQQLPYLSQLVATTIPSWQQQCSGPC